MRTLRFSKIITKLGNCQRIREKRLSNSKPIFNKKSKKLKNRSSPSVETTSSKLNSECQILDSQEQEDFSSAIRLKNVSIL